MSKNTSCEKFFEIVNIFCYIVFFFFFFFFIFCIFFFFFFVNVRVSFFYTIFIFSFFNTLNNIFDVLKRANFNFQFFI